MDRTSASHTIATRVRDPIEQLKNLQRWRGPKWPRQIVAGSIASEVSGVKAGLQRQATRLGNAVEAWEAVIPDSIRVDTRISGLAAGVLTVITGSATVSYALDRHLRSGGEAALRAATDGRVIRVRYRVGKVILDP